MKGQYLAVESVLTVAMGLTLAIGIIGVFGSYQSQISATTEQKEVETVNYRIQNAISDLKEADTGTAEVNIPETVGGTDYTVALDDGVTVITPENEYSHHINTLRTVETGGSAEGGQVVLYKSGNEYTLRSS